MENKNNSCCSSSCYETPEIENISTDINKKSLPWILGSVKTAVGKVSKIKTILETSDILGSIKVRLGLKRDDYKVAAGLYAVGEPDGNSPVLVTANYKLTFDTVRKELNKQNLWLLVLDTKGVNVWCAAGKRTFATKELINRIKLVKLDKIVSHNRIILPQLGAPGIKSYEVTRKTGFKVIFGPVRIKDIDPFLQNGMKASKDMRKVHFKLIDRLIVIPVEINIILKYVPLIYLALLLINLVTTEEMRGIDPLIQSFYNLIPYLFSIILGTAGMAVLLPYIPFRSFSMKGLVLSLILPVIILNYYSSFHFTGNSLILIAHSLLTMSITTFIALNFTGVTTYTSLSGVQKETLRTIPVVFLATLIGLGIIVVDKIKFFTS